LISTLLERNVALHHHEEYIDVIVKSPRSNSQLIDFLEKELALSETSIAIALRHSEQDPGPLPMILWQYGLVSLEQLEQIFDWLEG